MAVALSQEHRRGLTKAPLPAHVHDGQMINATYTTFANLGLKGDGDLVEWSLPPNVNLADLLRAKEITQDPNDPLRFNVPIAVLTAGMSKYSGQDGIASCLVFDDGFVQERRQLNFGIGTPASIAGLEEGFKEAGVKPLDPSKL